MLSLAIFIITTITVDDNTFIFIFAKINIENLSKGKFHRPHHAKMTQKLKTGWMPWLFTRMAFVTLLCSKCKHWLRFTAFSTRSTINRFHMTKSQLTDFVHRNIQKRSTYTWNFLCSQSFTRVFNGESIKNDLSTAMQSHNDQRTVNRDISRKLIERIVETARIQRAHGMGFRPAVKETLMKMSKEKTVGQCQE